MRKITVKLHENSFVREIEMIGDVEKIRWYQILESNLVPKQENFEKEIYSQEELDDLELEYEDFLLEQITYVLPII